MDFPKDAKALAGSGEFLWEVEARSDIKSLRRESSVFQVLPASEADATRKNLDRIRDSAGGLDNPAARYLAGSYLSGLGLYLDATDQFNALSKLSPTSPAPHEALGTVYSKIGLMDLAAAEFQQALALTKDSSAPH
jgi:Flp pilus assembly protein TadD